MLNQNASLLDSENFTDFVVYFEKKMYGNLLSFPGNVLIIILNKNA